MPSQEDIGQLIEYTKLIENLYNSNLITRQEWGTLNFQTSASDINVIYNLIKELTVLPLEELPTRTFNTIKQKIAEANDLFKRIDDYNIGQENHITLRNQLAQDIHKFAEDFHSIVAMWLPFLAYKKGNFQQNISEVSSSISMVKQLLEQTKTETQQKFEEINNIVNMARDASAQAGIVTYTKVFSEESDNLSKSSNFWLTATIILAAATLSWAFYSWKYVKFDVVSNLELLYRLGGKFAIIAILFTATIWTGRIFKALRHQAATNKHRALSLQTFQTFTNATSDEATKNAVLLEATKSIFGISSTGYLDQKDDSSESNVKIIEIFKSMLGPKD